MDVFKFIGMLVAVVMIATSVMYMIVSFIVLDFNILAWHVVSRLMLVFFVVIITLLAMIVYVES